MSFAAGKMVSTPKYIAFVVGVLVLAALLVFDADRYIFFIDSANLWFHEGGHFIFGLFSDTMGLYGGTLGQLIIPVICGIAFWRQKSLASVSVALLWFFENFFNIARYMADARAQVLPLFPPGPGVVHDWNAILSRWGALQYDTTIATILIAMGWLGLFLTLVGTTYLWRQDKKLHAKHIL